MAAWVGVDRDTGKALGGRDHLEQSIRVLITTRFATRVMRGYVGCGVGDVIDKPIVGTLVQEIAAEIIKAIGDWEPRLDVSRVGVERGRSGQLIVKLTGWYWPEGRGRGAKERYERELDL